MVDPNHPLCELLKRDSRYRFDAYVFVFEALRFAQEKLGMGAPSGELPSGEAPPADPSQSDATPADESGQKEFLESAGLDDDDADADELEQAGPQRHVSGQELCEAMRIYALEQYGYLAKNVLNHWGVSSTGDFGEIVFNLIDVEQMRKTPDDRREDFDDVYDFDEAFQYSFQFSSADSSEEPRL